METKKLSDNELIAEFMGMKQVKGFWEDEVAAWLPHDLNKFQTSWDWLMPAVEKIAEYRLAYPEETAKVCDCKIVIGLEYLYPKVVEFIKFYNQQKP